MTFLNKNVGIQKIFSQKQLICCLNEFREKRDKKMNNNNDDNENRNEILSNWIREKKIHLFPSELRKIILHFSKVEFIFLF